MACSSLAKAAMCKRGAPVTDDTALTHDEHLTVSCSAMDSSIWNKTNDLNTCSSLHFGILFGLRDFEGRTTEGRNLPCLVVHNPFGNRLIESQLAPCCWNGPPGVEACWKKHNKNNQWRKLANCCGHVGQIYGHVERLSRYIPSIFRDCIGAAALFQKQTRNVSHRVGFPIG